MEYHTSYIDHDSSSIWISTLNAARWEPCGLVQMEAMRLGTLPIVAPTGGLKDTVEAGNFAGEMVL